MRKSYQPINPKGRKTKPSFIDEPNTMKVSSIRTDDTEFGPGYFQVIPAESPSTGEGEGQSKPGPKAALAKYANKRGDKWFYMEIDNKRVLSYTGAAALPF